MSQLTEKRSRIRRQFVAGELDYLGAVDALCAIGLVTEDAEECVENWENDQDGDES